MAAQKAFFFREEAVYERDAVLGRETSSVFPKEAARAKKENLDNIKKAVGIDSSRFITESQVRQTQNADSMNENAPIRRNYPVRQY